MYDYMTTAKEKKKLKMYVKVLKYKLLKELKYKLLILEKRSKTPEMELVYS